MAQSILRLCTGLCRLQPANFLHIKSHANGHCHAQETVGSFLNISSRVAFTTIEAPMGRLDIQFESFLLR